MSDPIRDHVEAVLDVVRGETGVPVSTRWTSDDGREFLLVRLEGDVPEVERRSVSRAVFRYCYENYVEPAFDVTVFGSRERAHVGLRAWAATDSARVAAARPRVRGLGALVGLLPRPVGVVMSDLSVAVFASGVAAAAELDSWEPSPKATAERLEVHGDARGSLAA